MKAKILLTLAGLGILFGAYSVINQNPLELGTGIWISEWALLVGVTFLLLNKIYDVYIESQELKETEEAAQRLIISRRLKLETSRLVPPMTKPYTRKSFVAVEPNIIYAAGVAGVADPSRNIRYTSPAPMVIQEDNTLENMLMTELILEAIDSKYSHTPMEDAPVSGQGGNFSGAGASGDWDSPSTDISSDFGSCDVSSSIGD